MKDRRQHLRFTSDILDMHGKLSYATNVRIIDISVSGIALKTVRKMDAGDECLLQLRAEDHTLATKAVVVWSSPAGSIKTPKGNTLPAYKIGMKFTDTSEEKIKEIARFIEKHKGEEVRRADLFALSGLRVYVRFRIEAPEKAVMISLKSNKVRNIGLGGMLMESGDPLNIGSTLSLEISRSEKKFIRVEGRVVSCRAPRDAREGYDIGIEFLEVPDKDMEMLREIICLLENMGFVSLSAMYD